MASRPQEPTPPFPYLIEEVTLLNVDAGVTLAGTLTRPESADAVAAILLVPGSGAQDRDDALCGHRPFLVLADHLTRWGAAVLRLDDRGVGGSTGKKDECTHEDILTDVRTALDFLSRHHAIDPSRVGLIGRPAPKGARGRRVAYRNNTKGQTNARRATCARGTARRRCSCSKARPDALHCPHDLAT
ncbi:alpha/beta hydrolase family protein [Sorangium sp. So ce1128]